MTFCQICRHEIPGHEPNCPVFTGEPVRGQEPVHTVRFGGVPPFAGQRESQQPYAGTPDYGVSQTDQRILWALNDVRAELARIRELLEKRLPGPL